MASLPHQVVSETPGPAPTIAARLEPPTLCTATATPGYHGDGHEGEGRVSDLERQQGEIYVDHGG